MLIFLEFFKTHAINYLIKIYTKTHQTAPYIFSKISREAYAPEPP